MHREEGERVGERFVIESAAGYGAMGVVYRARDLRADGAIVALKRHAGGGSRERFLREGAVLEQLTHPAIVRYVAQGVEADGTLFLVMEWIEGETLKDRLLRQPLTPEEAIAVARRLAEALGAAHALGVVHRDIKPSNIMLRGGSVDDVVLVDFGLARPTALRELTETGITVGTPGYIAPEQARGDAHIDPRADIFGLGCVLYRCLTNQPPFRGDNVIAVLSKILLHPAPSLRGPCPELPEWLDGLVLSMLAKEASARPSAATVAVALSTPLSLGREPPPERPAGATALTHGEQRVVSIILVNAIGGAAGADGPTLLDAASPKALIPLFAEFGAKVERLANGTLVATLVTAGSATDQAARTARCALLVRKVAPVALVIATSRSELGEQISEAAIDRAAALLDRARESDPVQVAVRIDDVTAGLLDRRFEIDIDASGAILRRERDIEEEGRKLLGRDTPFVGREVELGTLNASFRAVVDDGEPRAVLVFGEAGAGKSRLRHELLKSLEGAEVWIARGDPMRAGSPFAMLGEMLRRTAGIGEGEPMEHRRHKLRARLSRNVAEAKATHAAMFLGEAIGVPSAESEHPALRAARRDPRLMAEHVRSAWDDLVSAEAAARPLVLVLEDLHWSDGPSVNLVGHTLTSGHPVFVLGLARPEVLDAFPRLWTGALRTDVTLSRLSARASSRLVRGAVSAPDDVVARIVELSGGNAFYLEELIRSVARGQGAELPATVVAMAQSRLDQLGVRERRVARTASIFGAAFWTRAVAALAKEDGTDSVLAELATAEVISRRGEARFPGQDEYVFRHAFVREAAYASLTNDDRRVGHRLAADWLLAAGESDAWTLAEHFARSDTPERAVAYYVNAASQAMDANDLELADRSIEKAAACGPLGELEASARLMQGEALMWRGETERCVDPISRALEATPAGSALFVRAAGRLATAFQQLQRVDEIVALADRLFALGQADPKPLCLAIAETVVALVHVDRAAAARRLWPLMQDDGSDPLVSARVAHARAVEASVRGDVATSIRETAASQRYCEACGDERRAVGAGANLGWALTEVGLYARAEATLRPCIAQAERLRLDFVVWVARRNLAWALARRGRLEEAEAMQRDAIAHFRRMNQAAMVREATVYLAETLLWRGDPEAAMAAAREVTTDEGASANAQAIANAALARALLASGRADEALDAAAAAVERVARAEEGMGLIWLAYADALTEVGRGEEAREVIARAAAGLSERAGLIDDEKMRAAFLAVPEHARLLTLVGRSA